ncbi:MAG: TlpA family protein disulfide reductase, partial [Daejeonella sp.]
MENNKKWLTKSNITTALMMIFVLALLISPQFKVIISQGLMKIGLFQPSIPRQSGEEGPSLISSSESVGEIVFEDENGKKISLSDHKGKVIFINFWTTWCPPCRAEMPSINALYEKVGKNSNVL